MDKKHFLLALFSIIVTAAYSWNIIKTNMLTNEGAWCWFADPRAISYENKSGTINSTYIGYIDVHGAIKATQINHLTNTTNEVLIRSWFQPDDHNNPTFLVLPDERIMIFYSRHTDEPCFYYRVSRKPGDITTLGREVRLETTNNTTYPSPFILSDDPGHIYLCWRGIGWHPTIARLTMPDADDNVKFDWGPFQMVRSRKGAGGTRPYAKYVSNGKDRIYLAYTTTHPDNQSINYIYLNYVDIRTKELKDIKGNKLSVVGGTSLHDVDATTPAYRDSFPYAVVDDTPLRNWLWEVAIDKEEKPVIAEVHISDDKQSHDYYYARWTGNQWQKTFLTHAGGHFHQTPGIENCYSGGMALDKADPRVVYGSVPVEGKYGHVYELKKFTMTGDGTLASEEQLTFDSPKNNIRPFVISHRKNDLQMAWMYGDYYDWIVSSTRPGGYPTAIRTNIPVSTGGIYPEKGLLKPNATVSRAGKYTLKVKKTEKFTIALTLSFDSLSYHGEVLRFAGLAYLIPDSGKPKPYLTDGRKRYTSTNVLGNSDAWQKANRSTGGQWYAPERPKSFHLAITYADGALRTYIDGLIDQYSEIKGLALSDVAFNRSNTEPGKVKIYNRALSQDEIKALGN